MIIHHFPMEECMSWGESSTFFRCCCSIFLVLDEECARLEIAHPPGVRKQSARSRLMRWNVWGIP